MGNDIVQWVIGGTFAAVISGVVGAQFIWKRGVDEALRNIRRDYVRRDDFKEAIDRIEKSIADNGKCLGEIKLTVGELKGLLNKKDK